MTLNRILNRAILSAAIGLGGLLGGPTTADSQDIVKTETKQEQRQKYEKHDHTKEFCKINFTSKNISDLETELAEHPSFLGGIRLSDLFFETSQIEKAGQATKDAIRMSPNDWKGYVNLATYFEFKNNYPSAFKQANKAIFLAPDNPLTHSALAILYFNKREFLQAASTFKRALDIDPKCEPAKRGYLESIKYSSTNN